MVTVIFELLFAGENERERGIVPWGGGVAKLAGLLLRRNEAGIGAIAFRDPGRASDVVFVRAETQRSRDAEGPAAVSTAEGESETGPKKALSRWRERVG